MMQNCEVCGTKKRRGATLMLRMYEGVVVAACRKCEDSLDNKNGEERKGIIEKIKGRK